MIGESELRRNAARWRVDPMVVDLDYCLGWFLVALVSTGQPAERLRVKGGTCLRKCYFAGYRFSEDLDFTATGYFRPEALTEWVERVPVWTASRDGPDFSAAPLRMEVIEDEYGRESYQVRVYFRGPLQWGGSPRAIRLDITRDERLLLPAVLRQLIHPYSDTALLQVVAIPCYDLVEVLAEKLRAVGGQRRYAISRDLYDIHRLIEAGVSAADAVRILPEKLAARGVAVTSLDVAYLEARRSQFEADWHRRLTYLVPDDPGVTFDSAWETTMEAVRLVQRLLR